MGKIIMSIGWVLMALGVSCADSENILIPAAMAVAGAILMYFGSKKNIKK